MSIREQIKKVLLKIVAHRFKVSESEVCYDSNFVEDLGGDSLDVIELWMVCEKEFDISIPDKDAESLVTFDKLLKYIEEHADPTDA